MAAHTHHMNLPRGPSRGLRPGRSRCNRMGIHLSFAGPACKLHGWELLNSLEGWHRVLWSPGVPAPGSRGRCGLGYVRLFTDMVPGSGGFHLCIGTN